MNLSTRTFRGIAAAGAVLLAGGTLAACGDSDSDSDDEGSSGSAEVTISGQWARSGTAGGNTAVYMELTGGSEPNDLVGASVSSDVATDAQIHETTGGGMAGDDDMGDMSSEDDMAAEGGDDMGDMAGEGDMSDGDDSSGGGMMSMQEVEAITIPAGETVSLEPGGFHVMLLELTEDLSAGDSIEVTLTFADGSEQTLTAEVRDS